MATRHVLVESLQAVRAYEAAQGEGGVRWHTHSPGLERLLRSQGGDVANLEEGVGLDEFNALGRASYAAAKAVCAALDGQCPWRDYFEFARVLEGAVVKVVFVPAYKALLLGRLVAEVGAVTVAGSPAEPAGASLGWGRLETLFARLATRSGLEGLSVFEHSLDEAQSAQAEKRVLHRRMGFLEKLASLCNNTPSSFACKTWRTMRHRGLWPTRHCSLTPRPRETFYLGKDCELIDESFLSMLGHGCAVGLLPPLPAMGPVGEAALPGRADLEETFGRAMRDALRAEGVDLGPLEDAAVAMARDKALRFVEVLHASMDGLTRGFAKVVDSMRPGATVLTNGYFDPVGLMFTAYCRSRGVRLVSFEHGITLGLSEWDKWSVRHFGALSGDVGVYHTREGAEQAAPFSPGQTRIVGGQPQVVRRVMLPWLQRRLGRRLLRATGGRRVVVFVAELERNNFVFGPWADNDLQFADKTEAALEAAIEAFPDADFYIKPYPSFRHADPLTFDAIAARHDNVRMVDDMDFRFIRTAADVIVLTSSQSTLGWCLGSGAPCLFYEFDWMPVVFGGMRLEQPGVRGLKSLRLLLGDEVLGDQGSEGWFAQWWRKRKEECR